MVGIDWQRVWTHRIRPRADHRYYTKPQADHRYYTKPQANHRFAPKPRVLRGDFVLQGAAATGDEIYADGISWGWDLGRAPRVHVVKPFTKAGRGCFGNVRHPNARRGNLCIFERVTSTNAGKLHVCDASNECQAADPWGASLGAFATDVGLFDIDGTWAVRPARHVRPSRTGPSAGGH
jgi:hypothetical protein